MPHMKIAAERPDIVTPAKPLAISFSFVVTLLFFAVLWLEVICQLKGDWSLNPQYGYGWSVPFLALYLIWKRWPWRPATAPPRSIVLPVVAISIATLLFFPIRFVAEANPDWRLLSWGLALIAVTMSILWIFLAGGWPWVRHFAFPICFFLVAVPWPVRFEETIIQDLMRAVTSVNVLLLNIAGVPALQHGNVIEVGSGLIGIEEACSGVRSLQATLMISLFLGELYSFGVSRRILLVVIGAVLAFVCNVARTAFLVEIGAHQGLQSIATWHDPAGLTILLVCLFGLWLVSLWMRRGAPATPSRSLPNESAAAPILFSSRLFAVVLAWFLVSEAVVQIWYGSHKSLFAAARWHVDWPTSENQYRSLTIPPEAEGLLHYNDGGGATWHGADSQEWMMFFFKWLPGRTAARFVKIHRPDICLPANGMTLKRDNGLRLLSVNGVTMPIRSYRFDDHGAPLHVFYCYWDARSSYENAAAAEQEDWSPRGRIRTALQGRREIGAQMLEVIVNGYADDAEAKAALERELAQLIRPG
jgi:exosortase